MVLGIFGFKDFDYVVGRYFLVLRFIGSWFYEFSDFDKKEDFFLIRVSGDFSRRIFLG